eukprot:1892435-Prorocentrum_lima.AAC.1
MTSSLVGSEMCIRDRNRTSWKSACGVSPASTVYWVLLVCMSWNNAVMTVRKGYGERGQPCLIPALW